MAKRTVLLDATAAGPRAARGRSWLIFPSGKWAKIP